MHAHETRKSRPEERLRAALERRLSNVSMDISTVMPPPTEVSSSRSLADNLPVATDDAPNGVFPSIKRDVLSISRACVAVADLVVIVASFYNGWRLPINQAGRGGHATGQPCSRRLGFMRNQAASSNRSRETGHGTLEVITRQANCKLSLWIKVVLLPMMLVFVVSAVIYMKVTQWIRVQHEDFLRATTPRLQADHADLLHFHGCDNTACQKYRAGIESSLNWSKDLCEKFYRYVRDGWNQHHHIVSILDLAEEEMYSRALNSVQRAPQFYRSNGIPTRSAQCAPKKAAALVKSCMRHSKNGFEKLKTFMAEHHLPWPMTSPKDLLDILFDLSGKWNIHLWFQVTFDFVPYQAGTGDPLLKIGSSAIFGAWKALMRTFDGQRRGTEPSLRYQKYFKNMLALFGVSELLAPEMASTIQEMDMLALEVLAPATVDPEQKILRLSIQNLSDAVTPGFPTDRWALFVDTHFPWAHRYSANIEVHAEKPSMLKAVGYLLGLKSETREALTLIPGLLIVTELGWMEDREIADATLQLFGLSWSSHARRCLAEVESRTGVAWFSLFPRDLGADTLIRDVRDVLLGVVMRCSGAMLHMTARKETSQPDIENYLASVLPESTPGNSYLNSLMKLTKVEWRLQQHDLSNIMKPRSILSRIWSVHGALTASEEYFVFPLYHSTAVNYGGAGSLLADEVLRKPFYVPPKEQQQVARYYFVTEANETGDALQEWSAHHVDTKALLAALKAYTLALLRHSPDTHSAKSSLMEDRLFFRGLLLCTVLKWKPHGRFLWRCGAALQRRRQGTCGVQESIPVLRL
ncbi:hypothetical protein V5799_006362 [Amblyomma americanum]|uniref:Peptidase M13 N-terminal domain-containing protein n=1 Tax=Amblyomma americanum TaxID=6943 RepID=A0AAQ4DWL7_AMBAM